jgi:hypothetical protein
VYRVRIVLEAAAADGSGFEALDLEAPFGPFDGAGATVALLPSAEAGLRVAGHLSEALEAALSYEGGRAAAAAAAVDPRPVVPGPVGHSIAPPPARELEPGVDPDASCESPLEAYCGREALEVVELLESRSRIAVCSPCRQALAAEGSALIVEAGV